MMAQLVWGGNSGVEIKILLAQSKAEKIMSLRYRGGASGFFLHLLRCRKNTACQAPSPKEHKILDALTDQSFIWTHRGGRQAAKRQLLDKLGSVKLKYSKLETSNVSEFAASGLDRLMIKIKTACRKLTSFGGPVVIGVS
jgi:hypothetical protein